MATYFLVHESGFLEDDLRPAFAAAWRQRSFAPCRALCRRCRPAALDYSARYHVPAGDWLLTRVDEVPFDRAVWRALVGELLLVATVEVPELPPLDTLGWLLVGGPTPTEAADRPRLHPIHQALVGSRDLAFGAAVYRPEYAGWNDAADVRRLAGHLAAVDTDVWTAADLAAVPDLADDEREEELAFACEWFAVVADVYARSADRGRAVVLERLA